MALKLNMAQLLHATGPISKPVMKKNIHCKYLLDQSKKKCTCLEGCEIKCLWLIFKIGVLYANEHRARIF